jgi:cytosine/adenosine deaminase-related metal-dependent hydrolase
MPAKYSAEKIFDGYRFLDNSMVLITGSDGVILDLIDRKEAGDDIQEFKGILSPGFINCHCHLELSHMKGLISQQTGLVKFVTDVVQQRHFPEEKILSAIEKAEDEMLDNGIVAVGDICNNTLTIPQKSKGRIQYHNFIEASGFHPSIARQRFDLSLAFYQQYAKLYSTPIRSNSIVPHAPYSVSGELWELIINFPGNLLLTIHNQESPGEDEWFETMTGPFSDLYKNLDIAISHFNPAGKKSLQTYLHRFLHHQRVILVHNVHTSEADLLYSKLPVVHCQLSWCLCPNANRYIGGELPDIDLFIKHGCEIVLGTDSLASNTQLSILEEIKTLRNAFPHIPLETMLGWATINGARTMERDDLLGSFEKGKKPGVLVVDGNLDNARRLV